MAKELIPAGGYIRMSTDEQRDSPARQRSELTQLAAREGCEIVEWFEDPGMTGTESAKRKDFQRLLGAVKEGRLKAILSYEQSRLSREDFFAAARQWEVFHKAGAVVITSVGGRLDFSNPIGLMMATFAQHTAHDESKKIGQRSASGRRVKLERGERIGGCPFAYDRELLDETGRVVKRVDHRETFKKPPAWKSRLVISHDVAAVDAARWMFQAIADGDTVSGIARELERRGVLGKNYTRKRRGALVKKSLVMTRSAVRCILKNPVYMGTLRAGASKQAAKFATVTEKLVLIENAVPAIVDRRTWERSQDALRRNSSRRTRKGGMYLLSGLLTCGGCGCRLHGHDTGNQRYACQTPGCRAAMVSAEALETTVLAIVQDLLLKPNEDAIRLGLVAKDVGNETAALEESLGAVRQKLAQAGEMLALATADSIRRIEAQVARWEADAKELGLKINRVRERSQTKAAAEASIDEIRRAHSRVLTADRAKAAALLRQLFDSISLTVQRVGDGQYRLVVAQLKPNPEIWNGPPVSFIANWGQRSGTWIALLEAVAALPQPFTVSELVKRYGKGRGWENLRKHLRRMKEAGFLERIGHSHHAKWRVTAEGSKACALVGFYLPICTRLLSDEQLGSLKATRRKVTVNRRDKREQAPPTIRVSAAV